MEFLIALGIVLAVITLLGHGIWILLRYIIRHILDLTPAVKVIQRPEIVYCTRCQAELGTHVTLCAQCGTARPSSITLELLKDLAATRRQLERLRDAGTIELDVYEDLTAKIQFEKTRLENREAAVAAPGIQQPEIARPQPPSVTKPSGEITNSWAQPSVVTDSEISTELFAKDVSAIRLEPESSPGSDVPVISTRVPLPAPAVAEPKKPFTEVLAAFMEQSNIRWGEIIGGLLIIGCSTALVVSLWAEISSIPVLKFLIFTGVTAALFGVGLYTEHRWKLPTTSRGILTIATLLVPLNFLAIAAVSSGAAPQGVLVLGSEFIAPALFLCLVYFAGRVITPRWPHLLAAGVLGSSVGQLLIRHFASVDNSPEVLLGLGAFPVICYVAAVGWMLWIALADREIDESETIAIFITLGALTFAAVLPFGLLLYKSGPVSMTMMYLAPLVTLGGIPMLACGTLLWKRVSRKDLVASRTAGTSMALLGVLVVFSGMVLAWPNPASIVPAALLNFAVLTLLAVFLEIPLAHVPAAICFSLAYLVLFHVFTEHVPWQNLRVVSLLQVSLGVSSGQALSLMFAIFLGTSEWLGARQRSRDGRSYLLAAAAVSVVSFLLLTIYGFGLPGDKTLFLFYLLYALGSLWVGRRHLIPSLGWGGAGLLLIAAYQALGPWLEFSFPWQTAFLVQSAVCTTIAIAGSSYCEATWKTIVKPLHGAALVSSLAVLICLLQANPWETTGIQARRVFLLAVIWLALLWVNRDKRLFILFQISLAGALVLAIKATLQQYEWYAYLPHAFLHPTALQIQGTMLVLLSLAWVSVRCLASRNLNSAASLSSEGSHTRGASASDSDPNAGFGFKGEHWTIAARRLLQLDYSFDRLVLWVVLGGDGVLVLYGAFPGVKQELTALGSATSVWNLVGFPHQKALGLGSWILVGLLAISMLANLWERRHGEYLLGALFSVLLVSPLVAGRLESEVATASAWRWSSAALLLLGSVGLWLRQLWLPANFSLSLSGEREGDKEEPRTENGRTIVRRVRILLLSGTLAPLLLLTAYPALRVIYYLPVHGPASGIFYALGDPLSYGLPLVFAALVLIGYAVRERLANYAFAGGLLFNATVTMVYLLSVVSVHGDMDRVVSVHVLHLNAIVAALYAIVWLSLRPRWQQKMAAEIASRAERLLRAQLVIATIANALVLIPVAVWISLQPGWIGSGTIAAGSLTAWLSFALTVIALIWFGIAYQRRMRVRTLGAILLGAVVVAAFTVARWNPAAWSGYHALMMGIALAAWLMCLAMLLPALNLQKRLGFVSAALERWGRNPFAEGWSLEASLIAGWFGGLAVYLALRVAYYDPGGIWWSIGALLSMTLLGAALNWQTLQRGYLYAAGILFGTATHIYWNNQWAAFLPGPTRALDVIVSAMCLSSIAWLALDLRARRKTTSSGWLAFHDLVAVTSVVVMAVIVPLRLLDSAFGFHASETVGFDWLAIFSLLAFMTACVWDGQAKYAVAGLDLTGLLAVILAVSGLELTLSQLVWSLTITLALYSLSTALLWHWRERIRGTLDSLRIPQRLDPTADRLTWLRVFNTLLSLAVAGLALIVVFDVADRMLRLTAGLAVGMQAATFALSSPNVENRKSRGTAFAALVCGLVVFGWAWLVPGSSGTWLNRAVILMVEMFGLVALFGLELERIFAREPAWARAIRSSVPWLTSLGMLALVFVLGTEVFYRVEFGAVRVNPLTMITVGLTLAAASGTCILFAVSSKHDPLGLSEAWRQAYVYVAEAMLALLFMHIRLTMPWLFTGFFERYWPIVVVLLAYAGVTASELLRRRGVLVLAHPIKRTGVFLPLLPVVGFWLSKPEVDYSVLLFIVGGLYGLVSILRKSLIFGILAVLAGNGGLWYLWQRTTDYGFMQHPQLWLIPVAGSVLVAAYLNREELSEDQMIGIRHLSLIAIYSSSTADIFINGVARSPWLPLVLAALSLAGVFGGIMLRIRAFLLLGSLFLLLAITTMIYYASANLGWTWLWYVAGIVTGAMIIFTFALFEKKRDEMLRLVEGLKEWDR